MIKRLFLSRALFTAVGLLAGLALGLMLSGEPMAAAGADSSENLLLATGPVDGEGEAVFCLDALTGDLMGWVAGNRGGLVAAYKHNVIADLGVNLQKNPRYVMVAGGNSFAGNNLANCVVWVGEVTTGKMVPYTIPWNRANRNANRVMAGTFRPLVNEPIQYRKAVIRPGS